MKLKLKRRYLGNAYTIGSLFVNGEYFCDTLEDRVVDINRNGVLDKGERKIMHKSAIPYGTYRVVVNMSPRFKRLLPRLLDVPHFDGILIHRGNTKDDTSGCILVGENKVKGRVISSTYYENRLVELLKNEKEITIDIV